MMISIPTRGVVFTDTLSSVFEFYDSEHDEVVFTETSPVSTARNIIAKEFLASKHYALLMIDDDEVLPLNALFYANELLNDETVVVIDCPSKRTGKSNIWHNKDGSIAASGFGCALFTRKIFETIPEPWFDLSPRRRMEKRNGDWFFPEIDDAPPNSNGGEDVSFSLKLLEHGFKIVEVPGLVCTHLEYELFNSENRATEILEIRRWDEITGPPA